MSEVRIFYTCGPMSGYPEDNWPLFRRVTAHLRRVRSIKEVYCPTELNPLAQTDGSTWQQLLKMDLLALLQCNSVALLPKWEKSKGATFKVLIGVLLGYKFYEMTGITAAHMNMQEREIDLREATGKFWIAHLGISKY